MIFSDKMSVNELSTQEMPIANFRQQEEVVGTTSGIQTEFGEPDAFSV